MSCVLQRGHSSDGCDLTSTLCLFRTANGGGVRSILLLPLVA